MITVEEVLAAWKRDVVIDETKLTLEIIKTPVLHAKYLDYYIFFKQKHAAADAKRNKLGWVKRKYFRGEMDQDDLKKHGWSQWNGLKPTSTEMNQLLEFDTDMNDLARVIADLKTAVTGCEYIMNALKGREYALKSIIDHQRFLSGA